MSTDLAKDEQSVVQLQLSFSQRLRNSPYYVVERTQNNELPRYSDKYRPSQGARATLRRRDLNPDFFPTEVLNDYFNPPRKRKCDFSVTILIGLLIPLQPKLNLDCPNA